MEEEGEGYTCLFLQARFFDFDFLDFPVFDFGQTRVRIFFSIQKLGRRLQSEFVKR